MVAGADALIVQFHDWLPEAVRAEATKVVRGHLAAGNDPAAVMRLATDSRMQTVWEYLGKRRQNGGGNPDGIPDDRRSETMVALFRRALICYQNSPAALSETELDDLRQRWRERAAFLREIAAELPSLGIQGAAAALPKYATALLGVTAAAEFYEQTAAGLEVGASMLVKRHRTPPHLRGFLVHFLWHTRRHFGTPLYGIAATIASVLFNQRVSKDMARSVDLSG